jgi:hypothetical protein
MFKYLFLILLCCSPVLSEERKYVLLDEEYDEIILAERHYEVKYSKWTSQVLLFVRNGKLIASQWGGIDKEVTFYTDGEHFVLHWALVNNKSHYVYRQIKAKKFTSIIVPQGVSFRPSSSLKRWDRRNE